MEQDMESCSWCTDEVADSTLMETDDGARICADCASGSPHRLAHNSYPHFPGTLYDCPACEAVCNCTSGNTECIFSGEHNGKAVD